VEQLKNTAHVWFPALAGIGTTVWAVVQFLVKDRRERETREFEAYHRLVAELVSPKSTGAPMWRDSQGAILFELRNFPRYFAYSSRLLKRLMDVPAWSGDPALLEEMSLTLGFLRQRPHWWKRSRDFDPTPQERQPSRLHKWLSHMSDWTLFRDVLH
jgi:hypothetical protein